MAAPMATPCSSWTRGDLDGRVRWRPRKEGREAREYGVTAAAPRPMLWWGGEGWGGGRELKERSG